MTKHNKLIIGVLIGTIFMLLLGSAYQKQPGSYALTIKDAGIFILDTRSGELRNWEITSNGITPSGIVLKWDTEGE